MIEIIKGTTKTPVSSQRLVELLKPEKTIDGQLYIGYPIFSTPEGRYPIDAILISPENGVIVFHIIEGTTLPDDYKEIQDDIYNKLEAKLRNHKALMSGRNLNVLMNVITYAPAVVVSGSADKGYPVCSDDTLIKNITEKKDQFDTYRQVLSVIQSISTIRKGIKKRKIAKNDSRGAKLQKLEESIANLDNQQSKAVIETVDTVQRIRGLAGSGKTIVLALKAAYLHSQNPEWNLAVTFQTRSLKG